MTNTEVRSSIDLLNDQMAKSVGIACAIPVLWILYGIAVYYGAMFPMALLTAMVLTSIVVLVVAFATYHPENAHAGPYGVEDFVGDIYEEFKDTFMIWLAFAVLLGLVGLGVTALFF